MHVTEDCCNSEMRPVCEAVEGHDNLDAYYRFKLTADISLYLSDAQRRQLLDVLSSAPRLPKPEPECECHDLAGDVADASECELHGWRGGPDAQF